jgi:MerR family transcriptional regulator, light-induced transcriptional regulator
MNRQLDSQCDTDDQLKRSFSSEQINWLVQAVEHSIVPRLIQSANISHPRHNLTDDEAIKAVAHFVNLILDNRGDKALNYVQSLEQRGASAQDIYLKVLTPVARRLGVLWEEDDCDFTQVTIGMWRLHQVLHELSARFQSQNRIEHDTVAHAEHEAILIPVPGSQHTLGLLMVVEFFRREGWSVWGEPSVSLTELGNTVKRKHYDLVGISISTEDQIEALKETIQVVTKASVNAKLKIMVGGPLIVERPHLAAQLGAHGSAPDASAAVQVANQLMRMG